MQEGPKAVTFSKPQDPREEYLAALPEAQRKRFLALSESKQAQLYALWQELEPSEREKLQKLAQDDTAAHNRAASCQAPKP